MERSITMKYNASISHGIEFNLGNGKYHSLSFSTLPDKLDLFLNRDSLFLYLSQYIRSNNSHINFERKKKHMFSHNHKELFREDKLLNKSNYGFNLVKTKRQTRRENEGISLYALNDYGIENIDSTFYVEVPGHNRNIHCLEQVFLYQRIKEIQNIEEAKRIAYNPCNMVKFNLVRLKDQYENKYPTVLNEYLSIGTNSNNMFTNKFEKTLNHNQPNISKNELIFAGTNKIKLNKLLTESFININVPQIFEMDSIKTSLRDRELNYDKVNYLLDDNLPNIDINYVFSVKNGLENNLYINNEWLMIGNNSTELHYIEDYVGLDIDLESKQILIDDYIQARTFNSNTNYFDNGVNLRNENIEISYDRNIIKGERNGSSLNINNFSFLINTLDNKVQINKDLTYINKNHHEIFNTEYVNLSKPYRNFNLNKDNQFLFRQMPQIYFDYYVSLGRKEVEATINDTNESVKKTNRKMNVYEDIVRLKYAYKRPVYITQNINVNLYDKGIDIYDVGIIFGKGDAGIYFSNLFKVSKDFEAVRTNETNFNLNINLKETEINDYYKTLNRYNKAITEEKGLFINKNSKGIQINEDIFAIGKRAEPILLIYDYVLINKNSHGSSLNYDYTGVSKGGHGLFTNYDYAWISKNKHDTYMNYDYAFTSKGRHNSSLIYEGEFIGKSMKDIQIDNYILNVDKESDGIYVVKNMRLGNASNEIEFDENLITLDKDAKGMQGGKDLFIGHENRGVDFINSGIEASNNSKGIKLEEIKFMDIDSEAIDIFKQMTVKEYSKDIFIQKEIGLEEESQKIWSNNYNKYFNVKRELGKTSIEESIRLSNAGSHGNLDYKGENVSKNKKATYIPEQSEFVKVIHYDPDPDIEHPIISGRIDELIMPHKDYTYNDFIKKLINDDGTLNSKYIKSYNANTGEYTVSIPVENPITIYADIGRDYIDIDVSILKTVTNLIKKVWKDNMYKYISMSAQDSLKHIMVEVDRLLITYNLKENERKEAMRCMQLFRWYAEMAVLNNCEYILKFDTKKISVDYYNKDLGDFKDIITFDNMEISDNYIIEPIDETKECSIGFKNNNINLSLPLNLSFRLYNINTSSSISIIDTDDTKTTKVYEQGIHDIKLELRNEVIVECVPSNKYQSMNIANLMIDNKSIRGFTVTYKGKFGETNSVMQDLLDSMLVVGEASEELKQKLSDVSPVTIAINTMVNYFKIHHENKLKGKRLIIKK